MCCKRNILQHFFESIQHEILNLYRSQCVTKVASFLSLFWCFKTAGVAALGGALSESTFVPPTCCKILDSVTGLKISRVHFNLLTCNFHSDFNNLNFSNEKLLKIQFKVLQFSNCVIFSNLSQDSINSILLLFYFLIYGKVDFH